MYCLKDGCVDTSALAVNVIRTSAPDNAFSVSNFKTISLSFGGTDTANQTINYQVIGWKLANNPIISSGVCYVPYTLVVGVATLGSTTYTTTTLGAATNLLADTITATSATTTRVQIHSLADQSTALLDIDVRGFNKITVDTDLGTAASADVFIEGSVNALGFQDVS